MKVSENEGEELCGLKECFYAVVFVVSFSFQLAWWSAESLMVL